MTWLTRPRRWFPLYLVLAVGLMAGYVLVAGLDGEYGFPLDDAWIHQTYARNFAETGRWEYVRGETSAGSTAPLWTLMIALGYWLRIPYTWWTWGLGALSLALTGWAASRLAGRLYRQAEPSWMPSVVGLLCLGEWHLVWAAASGMETTLFAALTLILMERTAFVYSGNGDRAGMVRWAGLGVVAGLLVLTRPEGVILIGLIGLLGIALLLSGDMSWGHAIKGAGAAGLGAGALLLPYLLFNLNLGGRIWPNTYYAKQAEYATVLTRPFLHRLGRVSLPPLTGFQILLLPGLLLALVRQPLREKGGIAGSWAQPLLVALPLCFTAVHLLLYAARLPVVYQHGRYLIPVIPAIVVVGVGGTTSWFQSHNPGLFRRVFRHTWIVATVILVVAFLVIGARAFGRDVAFIQGEMVACACWLAEHTEPEDLIAAHDIGAVGYFANRPILDLAGLITDEVVPLMGDERGLADYILASQARYLVTAPGWPYDLIINSPEVEMVYSSDFRWTVEKGMNNSTIYWLPE
jgi:hypothetical protein